METVAIIGVIALYWGPWLLTPIPAVLACRKDGLEATGQPLMLSAVAFPLAFIVVSILYSMLTAATAHGTFAVAATFSIVTHIIAGIVYLHPPQRIHPDIVPPRERLTGPADPPTRRLCRRPRPQRAPPQDPAGSHLHRHVHGPTAARLARRRRDVPHPHHRNRLRHPDQTMHHRPPRPRYRSRYRQPSLESHRSRHHRVLHHPDPSRTRHARQGHLYRSRSQHGSHAPQPRIATPVPADPGGPARSFCRRRRRRVAVHGQPCANATSSTACRSAPSPPSSP